MEEAAPSSDRYVMSDQLLARKTHHPSVEIEERTSTLTSPLYWREVLHSYFVEDAGDIKNSPRKKPRSGMPRLDYPSFHGGAVLQ